MEGFLLKQCQEQKLPLPDSIANAPELSMGLGLYYQAFLDLTTCRGTGYATEGPISWLAILQWADTYGIEGDQREALFYHIQALDVVYLDHKTKQLKKKTK